MERKVAVFGDSIPKGVVYEDSRLRTLDDGVVSIIAGEYGYDIVNYSRYGMTLKKLDKTGAVDRFLEDADGVDYAVFSIGGNDADYNWREVSDDPDAPHAPNTPVDEFERILSDTVARIKARGIGVILTTIPPVDPDRYFKNVICKTADGERVLDFFGGDLTNISRSQEAYNLSIIKVAAERSCPVIDLRTGFLLDRKYLSKYCIDGIHPNGDGHKFMAEEVVRSLAKQGLVLKKREK